MLKRFKLGSKLIAGFVLVAGFIAAAGIVGTRGLNSIGAVTDNLLIRNVPQAGASMELILIATQAQDMARSYLLESHPRKLAEIQKKFEEKAREFDALSNGMLRGGTFGDLTLVAVSSDEVRRLVDDARSKHELFMQSSMEMMEHHRHAVEKQHAALSDEETLAREDMDVLDAHGEKLTAVLSDIEDTAGRLLAGMMREVDKTESSARVTMIVLAIMGCALAVCVGVVLALSITRPMTGLAGAAKNAASGVQLNAEVLKNLDEINTQMMRVCEVTGRTAASFDQQSRRIEQIDTALEELKGQAEEMQTVVGSFRLSNAHITSRQAAHRPLSAGSAAFKLTYIEKAGIPGNGARRSGRDTRTTLLPFEEDAESLVLQEF